MNSDFDNILDSEQSKRWAYWFYNVAYFFWHFRVGTTDPIFSYYLSKSRSCLLVLYISSII